MNKSDIFHAIHVCIIFNVLVPVHWTFKYCFASKRFKYWNSDNHLYLSVLNFHNFKFIPSKFWASRVFLQDIPSYLDKHYQYPKLRFPNKLSLGFLWWVGWLAVQLGGGVTGGWLCGSWYFSLINFHSLYLYTLKLHNLHYKKWFYKNTLQIGSSYLA